MKKTSLYVTLLILLLAGALSSCKKADNTTNNNNNNTTTPTMTFTIAGTNYSYTAPDGMISSSAANTAAVSAGDPNNSHRALTLGTPHGAGTYSFNSTANNHATLQWTTESKVYFTTLGSSVGTGSVTVTTSVTSGTGTSTASFNTTLYNVSDATDSVIITNGSYSGKYYAQ